MAVDTIEITSILEGNQAITDEQFAQLTREVRGNSLQKQKFTAMLDTAVSKRGGALAKDPVQSLKVAEGFFALGRYSDSLDWLKHAGSGRVQSLLAGKALRALKRYDEAIAAIEQAQQKGTDNFEVTMLITDCLRRAGKPDQAKEKLETVKRMGDIRAEYHYQLGRLYDVDGKHEKAMEEYNRAITLDHNHIEALFSLAYACDLYGDEQQAVEYYEKCLQTGVVHVSTLLNLTVLYEEAGDYDKAMQCVKQVLACHPNHLRAQMYLKDITSSMTMYYDEDQERRTDLRNQVLQVPISDFELSVRSRNCLKKMNIRTLGDLLRVTEAELLAYKNFGETSLQEIKSILQAKGLRLGQLLENRSVETRGDQEEPVDADEDAEMLATPIGELALSVRARKGLQRLNINTLGDVVRRTEAELLGCKNFGLMSLNEIKQCLQDKGLALRTLEE
jgi:DNA-directed RNA polymerase subunit alpha